MKKAARDSPRDFSIRVPAHVWGWMEGCGFGQELPAVTSPDDGPRETLFHKVLGARLRADGSVRVRLTQLELFELRDEARDLETVAGCNTNGSDPESVVARAEVRAARAVIARVGTLIRGGGD